MPLARLARSSRPADGLSHHEGNQASTWIADRDSSVRCRRRAHPSRASSILDRPATFPGCRRRIPAPKFSLRARSIAFMQCSNRIGPTPDHVITSLDAGSTSADLAVDVTGLGLTELEGAQLVADFINQLDPAKLQLRRLLIQEWLNPLSPARQTAAIRANANRSNCSRTATAPKSSRIPCAIASSYGALARRRSTAMVLRLHGLSRRIARARCHSIPRQSRSSPSRTVPHRHFPRAG